jgi:hypothetical protein
MDVVETNAHIPDPFDFWADIAVDRALSPSLDDPPIDTLISMDEPTQPARRSESPYFPPGSPLTLPPLPEEFTVASAFDVTMWQLTVSERVPLLPDSQHVLIWGQTVADTAQCLLNFIRHLHRQSDNHAVAEFLPPPGIHQCQTSIGLHSFVQKFRNIKVYVTAKYLCPLSQSHVDPNLQRR